MSALPLYDNQGFLVINGTQGIAPNIILRAAQRNANVLFTASPACERDAQQLLAYASSAGLSDRVSFVTADLMDEQSVEDLVDTAAERLNPMNALIQNLEPEAVREHKSLVNISLAEWNSVLAKEMRVPFMLARRMVEEFLFAQVPGRILYIGYSEDERALPTASHATARAGLQGLVRCVTKEFGRREVACNAIIVPRNYGDEPSPSGDFVETVLFFATSEASFVNGEFLCMSG